MKHDVRVTEILGFVAYIPRLALALSSILTEMREARLAEDVQIFVKVGLGHDSK